MQAGDAVILGIVEGLTEFLPISSTGHLNIASDLMQLPDTPFRKTFTLFIQFVPILRVLIMYWRALLVNWRVMLRVAVAFVPAGIIGYRFYDLVRKNLGDVTVTLWALAIGGVVLVVFEWLHGERRNATEGLEKMSLLQA